MRDQERGPKPIFWTAAILLLAVPLAFCPSYHRIFTLPRFLVLLIGSGLLLSLLINECRARNPAAVLCPLRGPLVLLVSGYVVMIAISTALGIAAVASLMGTFDSQMGLISYLCFFTCFIGLIVGIGGSERRLNRVFWAMTFAGLITSIYALFQFVGADPLIPSSTYTFDYGSGPVVRPVGTIGHADYLGNFLLYTCPVSLALAIRGRGRERRLAFAAFALSLAAIIVSGTRGAWLGILAGLGAVTVLEFRKVVEGLRGKSRTRVIGGTALAILVVAAVIVAIGPEQTRRSIVDRVRSVFTEGFSGAGRTLLWKDSLSMAPRYALVGCGPEAFKKALLAYKSKELAQLSPSTNNESSHDSYMDAAISYGLPGAVLYVAIFAAMLIAAIKAWRKVAETPLKWTLTGIISSIVAVAVHNIFIFDQIPTGLYFFALAALTHAAYNVVSAVRDAKPAIQPSAQNKPQQSGYRKPQNRYVSAFIIGLFVIPALWYSIALSSADLNLQQAFVASRTGSYADLLSFGTRAASAPDPTGSYHFMFARLLSDFADREAPVNGQERQTSDNRTVSSASSDRSAAIALAIDQSQRALPHNMEPNSIYLLLAYLESLAGDAHAETAYARDALSLDPNYANARLMMGEAFLANGDIRSALAEGYAARELDPRSERVTSLIARCENRPVEKVIPIDEMVAKAGTLVVSNPSKAFGMMTRALVRDPNCGKCHRILAEVHERAHRYNEAIAEWQKYMEASPEQAAAENVAAHINELKQRAGASQ